MSTAEYTVLCVDDEPNILSALKRLLRKENYRLLTATGADEAMALLEAHTVHLVMSDQRMPQTSGTDLLARVRERYPETIRIILSGYMDVDAITDAVNKGHVFKYFLKPWNDQSLILEIRQALEQYELMQANKRLNEALRQKNMELEMVNENLEAMVKERTEVLELQNAALALSHAVLDELPLPVAAVSAEGMIVMMNKGIRNIITDNTRLAIGQHISEGDLSPVARHLDKALATQRAQRFPYRHGPDADWIVDVIPLSGGFHGRGFIIALSAIGDNPASCMLRKAG